MVPSKARTRIAFLALCLFISLQSAFSQEIKKVKLIIGLNFYNTFTDLEGGGGYSSPDLLSTFRFSPQIGLTYRINRSFSIRYLRSQNISFFPQESLPYATVSEIRKLDRATVLYHFKNRLFVFTGFTNLLGSSEYLLNPISPFSPNKRIGYQGIHLGVGKQFSYGSFELSNLLAFEFEEMTPASLFAFWVLDFNYDIGIGKRSQLNSTTNEKKDLFGFGFVGSLSPFLDTKNYPIHPLLTTSYGIELFYNLDRLDGTLFFRRTNALHIVPLFSSEMSFPAQWNLIGYRQHIAIKDLRLYGSASYLNGYNSIQTYPEVLSGKESTIHGFNLGIGYPVNRWAFELSTDCYLKTPLPSISKGFGWDRIRLSAMYYLPIATKK